MTVHAGNEDDHDTSYPSELVEEMAAITIQVRE